MRSPENIVASRRATLREVLTVIDKGTMEIAVIVDDDEKAVGTVTDGDIRRAILRGFLLETPAERVMNQRFTAVGADASPGEVLALMRTRSIKQIPVLGPHHQLIGIHLLQDLMGGPNLKPNWAVVMAGGEGRRLRPLTESTPKPMLPIGNQPLLERIIAKLVEHGFCRIFLSINYLGGQVEDYFGDGKRLGCSIEYLREVRPLGTGGALTMLPECPSEPLLVANGDLLTELNFSALMDYHTQQQHDATICVREFSYQVPYGVVRINGDSIILSMEEKPTQRFLINAGIYVIEPKLLSLIPNGTEYHLPTLMDAAAAIGKQVGAFPIREYWMDIGQIEDYELAKQHHAANGEYAR